MIDYVNKDLFCSDGVSKQIIMDYDGGQITNSQIHFEQFELQESLCSEEQLRFGCCESSMLKFRIVNPFDSLKGKELTVSEILNGDTVNPFKYGKYKVQSDVPSADRSYRDVTAYDAMYEIINADVADWYNSLTFPMSIKTFRNAFISHFGLIEEEIDLVNDTIEISKTIEPTTLSGKDVINAICEINGCFGNISRDGKFRYIYLKKLDYGLLPSTVLYPSDTLLPKDVNAAKINSGHYKSCSYEDYMVNEITQLQIRTEENDIGVLVGEEGNKYVIQDNFLVYGMSTEELTPIAQNILDKIYFVSYQPFSASTIGNPTIEIGDLVRINTKSVIIDSYVLKRTIKGIQSLTDTLDAGGDEYYSEDENTIASEIRKLKGKSNVLERTIEKTKSEIKNVEKGLQSEITQTAGKIELKVDKNGIIAAINLSTEKEDGSVATIKADRISLEGLVTVNGNFKVLADGSIEAVNGKFFGDVLSYSSKETCFIHGGCIVLYQEEVSDPYTYETDIYSVIAYDRLLIQGSGYFTGDVTSEGKISVGYDPGYNNSIGCSNWFRSSGKTGWFNATYGGGVYQNEAGYVRLYGSCGLLTDGAANGLIINYGSRQAILRNDQNYLYLMYGNGTALGQWTGYPLTMNLANGLISIHGYTFNGTYLSSNGAVNLKNNGEYTVCLHNTQFRPTSDFAGEIYLGHASYRWKQLYVAASSISTSDRRMKKDFETFGEKHEKLFLDLKPTIFRFINGESNRKHFGFISQDVEEALFNNGLDDKEFAGFCKDIKEHNVNEGIEGAEEKSEPVLDENGNPEYIYSLRYEEFIALNTHMIQKLYKEIDTLKEEIAILKTGGNLI